MPLYKHNVGLLQALRKPVAPGYAPLCMTCGRYLDGEQVVESKGSMVKVLGRHHGAEELVSFDLGTEHWDEDDVANAMRGHLWFDPTLVEK